jgi:C_GCAxxG_C_C family probable redox protein
MNPVDLFHRNYNCCQAVFAPYAEKKGIPFDKALLVSAGFGAGCRMGDLCGAVTGAVMVLGLYSDLDLKTNPMDKMVVYRNTEAFIGRFREIHGSHICRELLKADLSTAEGRAEAERLHLFSTLCPLYVETADRLLKEALGKSAEAVH